MQHLGLAFLVNLAATTVLLYLVAVALAGTLGAVSAGRRDACREVIMTGFLDIRDRGASRLLVIIALMLALLIFLVVRGGFL